MGQIIPLSVPNFEGNERKYVDDAIEQGWVSTGGAYITKLESMLADFLHTHDVAACQSGTSAIHLALVDAGVGPNDVVLVPPLTFIAAVNPVKYQFAIPVFIDCDDSLCMDPNKLRSFCENECEYDGSTLLYLGRPVKALVVVHVFGNMSDMVSILEIAKKYNIIVIEDATEALGTRYTDGPFTGKYAGTIGDYGCFSFNGNKIITTGGGGAITAKDPQRVGHIRYLSTQAKNDSHFYIHNEVGYNYRMTNVQAAIGVAQMEELDEFILRKQRNYEEYCKLWGNCKLGKFVAFRNGTFSNKWLYSLVINRDYVNASLRDIIGALSEEGIETRAIWGLINEQLPYIQENAYMIERASYFSSRVLNLPSSTNVKEEDIKYVVDKVKYVLEANSNGKEGSK